MTDRAYLVSREVFMSAIHVRDIKSVVIAIEDLKKEFGDVEFAVTKKNLTNQGK